MDLALTVLAANVAAVYFTIATVIVPRIVIGNVAHRYEWVFRAGAIMFFVGCGLSHLHTAVHALDGDGPAPFHQIWMHVLQVVGGWTFVFAAISVIDIRVENRNPRFAALEDLAQRDPLTGAFNRRHLDDLLSSDVDHPVSVVAIDLDGFKKINDEHGHAIGDHVLTEFVGAACRSLRPTDAVVRSGGDEFLVVLQGVEKAMATTLVERIRSSVSQAEIAEDVRVSFSAGVASCPVDTEDPTELPLIADAIMYDDKRIRHCASGVTGG